MSRYRRYDGGDPLAPPVDLAEALDAIGQEVMAGYSPERAMREFLRRGGKDQQGLDGANWSSIVPVVSDQVKVARSRAGYGTKYNQISTAVQNMEQAVLTGQTPAKDAASQAAGEIKPLLPQG